MDVIYPLVLLALNLFGLFLVLLSLPGTWFMVAATAGVSWLTGMQLVSWTTVLVLAGVALLGEVLEFLAGAAGSRRAGGTWRATVGAMVVSVIGGIVLGAMIFPIIGAPLGACIGAFLGALAGELSAGKKLETAVAVGQGAFVGRLLGTIVKLVLGGILLVIATIASFA